MHISLHNDASLKEARVLALFSSILVLSHCARWILEAPTEHLEASRCLVQRGHPYRDLAQRDVDTMSRLLRLIATGLAEHR